jgi:uncharacterized protein DUF6714
VTSREQVETAIRDAFRGVRLGEGVSLQQAELIDDFVVGLTPAEFARIPDLEVTDDWTAVSAEQLEMDNIAHLDAEGLRYYLPAFLLYLLDHYDGGEMWTIGTLGALDQRDGHPSGFLELLTPVQGRAIADYVRALPQLVDLDDLDRRVIERADRDVWSRYHSDDEGVG